MDDSYRRKFALSLALPLCNDFKILSLVSQDFSSIARPYLFRILKPISTANLASQPCLQLLLSEDGWEQACCVQSATIHLDELGPDSAYAHPADAAAEIISRLPFLLHITLVPNFKVLEGRHVYPAQNFDSIARAMAGLTRLRSLNMSGLWLGGRTASIGLLQQAATSLEQLELTISARRDAQFCTVMVSHAPYLHSLKIHGPLDLDKITSVIRALPRPDRLRKLQISISGSDEPWCQAEFWSLLPGLEVLYVTTACRWQDFDHTGDALPQDGGAPQVPIDTAPGRQDEETKYQLLSSFLLALPSLRELYVKGGSMFFPWPQAVPYFQSLREGYKNGIILEATDFPEDRRVVMMMIIEGYDDYQYAAACANTRRRANFISLQICRVFTWAQDVRERLVRDATIMANIAPALGRLRWMPYEEDTTPWMEGDCGDGDFIFDIILQRPSGSHYSVDIGGGIKRVARSGQGASVIAPRDATELPFGGDYDIAWVVKEEEPPSSGS